MTAAQPLWMYTGIAFAAGLVSGALLTWLANRARGRREAEGLRIRLATLTSERDTLNARLLEQDAAVQRLREENQSLQIGMARLQTARSADAEKLQWVGQARAEMREAFEALAGQTLQASTDAFIRQAREHAQNMLGQMRGDWQTHKAELRHLVDPVRESLTALDGHVRDLEQKRQGAYDGLQEQLRELSRTQSELRDTTVTLSQALKSPTARGRWGEIQLRRVVEMAGMVRHVAFTEQVSVNGGRPDMVVYLPNAGILPVDAKVSLKAYLKALEATEERERNRQLAEYAKAVQARVRELGQKCYWAQFDRAPDFVVMFVPSETCLGAAFESAPNLLEYAVEQRVLITTPVTLIALLRSVAFGWQQYRMTENARHIAEQGRTLYKRLERFTGHLSDLGRNLGKTVSGYNRAVGSLERRLVPVARRFQDMTAEESEPVVPEPLETRPRLPKGAQGDG